jgi:hypothetical protein
MTSQRLMPARNAGLSSQSKQFKMATIEIFPGDDY